MGGPRSRSRSVDRGKASSKTHRSRSRERRRPRDSRSRSRDRDRHHRRDSSRERRRGSSHDHRQAGRGSSPSRRQHRAASRSRSRSRSRPRSRAGVRPAAAVHQADPPISSVPPAASNGAATREVLRHMSMAGPTMDAPVPSSTVVDGSGAAVPPPAARLGALAALKAKLAASGGAAAAAAAAAAATTTATAEPSPCSPIAWAPWDGAAPAMQPPQMAAAWAPWEDPSVSISTTNVAAAPTAPVPATVRAPAVSAPAALVPMFPEVEKPSPHAPYTVPLAVAIKKAKADAEEMREKLRAARGPEADEADPLDAFMAEAVLPEVQQRAQEEAKRKEEERIRLAELLKSGKPIKPLKVLEELSEEDEETPDLEIWVPTNKVKLIVGAGGLTIGAIQKKSKARVQIVKDEETLNRAFGSGPAPVAPPARTGAAPKAKPAICDGKEAPTEPAAPPPERKMTKVQLFGDAKQLEIAERMIWEAVENKEQKAKQREKEYERKRDAKSEKRMLYHLRHTNDYEVLGVPIGSSRADIKKAYRKLALQWHPDKHQGGDLAEAVAKFQAIQKAYDALTTTSEDDKIEALTASASANGATTDGKPVGKA